MNVRAIQDSQDLGRVRTLSLVSFLTYWMWHFFYLYRFTKYTDSLALRLFISIYSGICFYLVSSRKWSLAKIRPIFLFGLILHLANESYIVGVNDWHQAFILSYLAVAMVVTTSTTNFTEYIVMSCLGAILPYIVFFFVPIDLDTVAQLLVSLLIIFVFVGLTVKSNFKYRQEIIEQNMASIQNSKMAALGQMAAGVAHEINNPLAIIKGKADQCIRALGKGQATDAAEILPHLEKISFTVDRIAKIIKGLSSFSRDSANDQMIDTDFNLIVNNTLYLCEEKLRSSSVAVNIAPLSPLLITCHESQLTQVLLNLISNAVDAMTTSKIKTIDINFAVSADKLKVMVVDSGPGIPKEIQHKLMEPFFTTKEIGKGTGLGLSISQGIAASHGGRLYLDTAHKNTCFTLELPIAKRSSRTSAKAI